MKMKMKLFVLIVSLLLSATVADRTIWKEIITLDCNFGMHAMDSFIPFSMQAAFFNTTFNIGFDSIREAVNCKCPIPSKLSENEFRRRFIPGMPALLNMAKGQNMVIDNQDTCPLSLFSHSFADLQFLGFQLPSTCSLELWEAGQPCFLQYNVPSFDAVFQVATSQCTGSYLPYISVTCSGNGCANYFKPCSVDSDCGGQFTCNPMYNTTTSSSSDLYTNVFNILKDMDIYDNADVAPGCYSSANVVDAIAKLALSYYTSTVPTSSLSDLHVCGFKLGDYDMYKDFTNCVVSNTTNPNMCAIVDTYINTVCPNVVSWNGVLSDSTSAVAPSRLSGAAFTKFAYTPGPGNAPVISLFSYTCDSAFTVFGTEKYAMGMGMEVAPLIQAFQSILMNTQNCRTPILSLNQFRAAFEMWSADFWAYLFSSPEQPSFTSRSTFLSLFNYSDASARMIMPSTCSYATIQSTGSCAVQWTGLQNLLNLDITIRGKMRRCSSAPEGTPEVYLECEGADCANLFRPKFCNQDSDCPSNLICYDLTTNSTLTEGTYNPIGLLLWGRSSNATAACPYNDLDLIPASETCSTDLASYYTMLRNIVNAFTGAKSTVTSGLKMCLFDYDAVVNNGNQWAKNMVVYQGADFYLQGMSTWTNAFADPDPAVTTSANPISSNARRGSALDNVFAIFVVFVLMMVSAF